MTETLGNSFIGSGNISVSRRLAWPRPIRPIQIRRPPCSDLRRLRTSGRCPIFRPLREDPHIQTLSATTQTVEPSQNEEPSGTPVTTAQYVGRHGRLGCLPQ